jgi:hypothetical protein
MKHNAIVVTDWDKNQLTQAHEKAKEIFNAAKFGFKSGSSLVSEVITSVVNSQLSFFIAPDGSKEGWADSETGDKARKEFLDWLLKNDNYCDYIEICFGGDDDNNYIIRTKDSDIELDEKNNRY